MTSFFGLNRMLDNEDRFRWNWKLLMRADIRVTLVLVALLLAGVAPAHGDIFLDLAGVPGESTDAQHAGEIEILSWSWEMSAPYEAPSGGAGGRTGPVAIGPLSLIKYVDKSSPPLMLSTCNGHKLSTAVLVVRRDGALP